MTDFSLRCDYKPRQHGDYAEPKRGHATVDDGDGHGYRYRVRAGDRRAFRRWLTEVFAGGGLSKQVRGAWPRYWVENK